MTEPNPTRLLEDPSQPALKRLLEKLPPATPPPGARERSWRGVSAKLGARPPLRALAMGAALGAAVTVAVLWAVVPAAVPPVPSAPAAQEVAGTLHLRVVPLLGEVEVLAANGEARKLAEEGVLQRGDRVKTGAGTRAILRFDSTLAELNERSSLRVAAQAPGGVQVVLESGGVAVQAQPGTARTFSVGAGSSWVEGASYLVRLAADGSDLRVTSYDGSTVLRQPGGALQLNKGDTWPPHPVAVAEAKAPPPVLAPQAPRPAPATKKPAVDGAALWAEASAALRNGRPKEAIAPLQTLSATHDAYAGLALYELGRVRARHLGDPAAARQAFREYRARFPQGPLRTEVDVSLAELLLGQRELDEAQAVIDELLAHHRGSAREPELRLLRAHALRERGQCQAAAGEYAALGDAAGRVGEDALYYGAFCEQRLGRWEAAGELLRTYLSRHPSGRFAAEAKKALELF